MATFNTHLLDLKWLLYEKGLQHVYNSLKQFAAGTIQGNVTGVGAIGLIELDAASNPGLTAALTNTVNPSGQLSNTLSTTLEYGTGATAKTPPTQTR